MKKNLICIFLLFSSFNVFSQGIEFEHTSWSEVVKKAKALNKPIFVDVYTSWCGPCKVMAAQVFTRPEIGAKYNQGFVNVKIDAEKGEGIALAKKYEVKSYPNYLFIDPNDESLFDRAKSSMPASDFSDVADKMLMKYSGKKETSLADLDAKYKTGNYDEAFAKAYIKRLKAEGKSTRDVLAKYLSKFVTKTPSTEQLYFLGLNYTKDADINLYNYMIANYKTIDAILCKRDGISAANLYRNLRDEISNKIEDILISKQPVSSLDKLFADLNAIELDERKNKKVLEYQIRIYTSSADTAQLLQTYRTYIKQFFLPSDKTNSIGKEAIILDKNAPIPTLAIEPVSASDWCANYAIKLSTLSKDAQDQKLAAGLFEKALALNNSSVIKNKMNIATYNFGDKKKAIEQQTKLLADMKTNNDEYLIDAEATLQKMMNNTANIAPFSYKRKVVKKN